MNLAEKAVLQGTRVLDCTFFQLGPMATLMLGDLGAEIIKVEPPITGDPTRGFTHIYDYVDCRLSHGLNMVFEVCNRNKKSITLDLKRVNSSRPSMTGILISIRRMS
jgi:crotonobetainyl-CoA:carnitine CoA-transferase CaiB-like acyl-CoA transferase